MSMRATGSPPERVAGETPVPDEWVRALSAGGAERERATARLHEMLLRVARAEARRRSGQLRISGPELDDLAHQAAADAVVAITAKIGEFRGESRFTTLHHLGVQVRHLRGIRQDRAAFLAPFRGPYGGGELGPAA
jgi:hypothetical protein